MGEGHSLAKLKATQTVTTASVVTCTLQPYVSKLIPMFVILHATSTLAATTTISQQRPAAFKYEE